MRSARRAGLRRLLPRRRLIAGAALLLLLCGLVGWVTWPRSTGYTTLPMTITVRTGPDGTTPIALDATYYRPEGASAAHPVPAVLLAHGFGGTKDSVAGDAGDLASHGFAVLTWTAEGFGRSGGQIHLDSPDWEVRDGQRLLDWLAARPEVKKDGTGDPRVGVVGGSYGGALALLLAGYDRRVDAIVPEITWNDLARAFLPESTGAGPGAGVFKKAWAGLFFGSGGSLSAPGPGLRQGGDPSCGRFAPDVCQAYLSVATAGTATDPQIALLRRSSPATILNRIAAPTLLIQGEADSLFPLSEADANARGIAAAGTPVQVAWYTGGHDGGQGPQSDQDRTRYLTEQWLGHYLRGQGQAPATAFTFSRITGIDASTDDLAAQGYTVSRYPGLMGQTSTAIAISGPPQPIANPPNGTPAAQSSIPGAPAGVAGLTREVPGQHADFLSPPLASAVTVVGAPAVRISAASPTGEAVLFVKLYDLDPASGPALPDGLVAPVHLTGLPRSISDARPVTVTLPAIVHQFGKGHRLLLTVASSDQAYATPPQPAVYTIAATDGVTLPLVQGTPIPSPDLIWRWVLLGVVAALALALAAAILLARRRLGRADRSVHAPSADLPLVIQGLRKEYGGGLVAVSAIDFTVRRGQVVGLLGPNGAGKTTTLRMLMGLIMPTAGDIYVFGHRLVPGAPILSRLGALVEGPGFLPHLSGRANLYLFWQTTGRPEGDARFGEVMDIAGLGDAIDRRVRTYSHGMKQRLAVAQAMLGLPDLLVLDEPTDGLDPPQIAEMRRVLHRYAMDGRAVLLSSHLLAEVEQTCTHVIVVNRGEVAASGPVDDIVGDSPTVRIDVSDAVAAVEVLRRAGLARIAQEGNGTLVADLDGMPRAAIVAALVKAGIDVSRVVPRRRLEDAFLALVGGDATERRHT